jgi:hypothetical protein
MDPLFLLLPALERAGARMSPLHQHLRPNDGSGTDLSILLRMPSLPRVARRICDDREGIEDGEENRLFRLNSDKVLAWLEDKVNATARALQVQADAAAVRARIAMRAFSTTSRKIEADEEGAGSGAGAGAGAGSAGQAKGSSPVAAAAEEVSVHRDQLEAGLSIVSEYLSDEWTLKLAIKMG